MPGSLKICGKALEAMRKEARDRLPEECCGLLAGVENVITHAYPMTNTLASPREYFMDPGELIKTLRVLRENGLRHLGIYHSHPASENFPSPRDVEMAFYPSCAYFIISPVVPIERQVRAFEIQNGHVTELEIAVV